VTIRDNCCWLGVTADREDDKDGKVTRMHNQYNDVVCFSGTKTSQLHAKTTRSRWKNVSYFPETNYTAYTGPASLGAMIHYKTRSIQLKEEICTALAISAASEMLL
jgi:hypothetical protein